jgi:hypothetical protein
MARSSGLASAFETLGYNINSRRKVQTESDRHKPKIPCYVII